VEPGVDGSGVAAVRLGKGRPQPILIRSRHDQVDMVGHQTISPNLGVRASRRRGDQAAVKAVILRPEEHRLAAIAALSDVMRQTRHNYAGNPRYALASNSASFKLLAGSHYLVNCHCNPRHCNPRIWQPLTVDDRMHCSEIKALNRRTLETREEFVFLSKASEEDVRRIIDWQRADVLAGVNRDSHHCVRDPA